MATYVEIHKAVQRILARKDEIAKELIPKLDALQAKYEQEMKDRIPTHEEMNKPFDL